MRWRGSSLKGDRERGGWGVGGVKNEGSANCRQDQKSWCLGCSVLDGESVWMSVWERGATDRWVTHYERKKLHGANLSGKNTKAALVVPARSE